MKLGNLLGILSPGLSATGLFGKGPQQGGIGALSAMSPLLALLLHHNKQSTPTGPEQGAPIAPAPAQAVTDGAMPMAHQGMDPAKRQQLAAMLLQLGGGMNRSPFGNAY